MRCSFQRDSVTLQHMHKFARFYLCWNISILKSNVIAEIPLLFKVIYFLMVYLHSEICILFHRKCCDSTCPQFSSVQSLSRVQLFATPWTVALLASLSITNSQSLFKLMSIESVMPSNHLILWHPLLLMPSIFPSFRVFSNESVLHVRWPKYWSFSFSIGPSKEHPRLISFRMDWLDLLAVQGTLKSLLQHHSSKASILRHSAFL